MPPAGQQQPDPPPPHEPPPAGWGAPPPPPANRARWSMRRTLIAVAVAVGIAAAGGVAIYAASGSTGDNQGGPGGGPGGGPNVMRDGGGPVVGGPLGDTEHGEFQNGEVTAISDDSITAKSDDGYTRTYTIDSDTVMSDGIEKGDDVMIVAASSDGDQATATMISERGQGMLPQRRDGQDGQNAPPNGGGGN
jgi:hypothetical protein